MKLWQDNVTSFESPSEADAIARKNKRDDPDWSYRVVWHPRTDRFHIKVCDENGEHVGYL